MNKRTEELFKNVDFLKKVSDMDPETAQKEFEREGSDITIDELKEIAVGLEKYIQNNGELTEEKLDDVNGGLLLTGTAIVLLTVPAVAAAGGMVIMNIKTRGW